MAEARNFEAFLEHWLISLERHLHDLLHVLEYRDALEQNEHRFKSLIDQVVAHYRDFFEANEKVAQENMFHVISPTWFSAYERAYLWIGGFRPGVAFRLIRNNIIDLTEDQFARINSLMEEIKAEEEQVSDELSRVQEWMVSPAVVELMRHHGRLQNGEVNKMDSALERLEVALKTLVECADFLRKKTGILILEILKPAQGVRFLAAAASMQLRLRRLGMHRVQLTLTPSLFYYIIIFYVVM